MGVKRLREKKGGGIRKSVSQMAYTNVAGSTGYSARDSRIVTKQVVDPAKLRELAKEATSADQFSASEALDSQLAHYAVS